jgi:hypothetical protein
LSRRFTLHHPEVAPQPISLGIEKSLCCVARLLKPVGHLPKRPKPRALLVLTRLADRLKNLVACGSAYIHWGFARLDEWPQVFRMVAIPSQNALSLKSWSPLKTRGDPLAGLPRHVAEQ